MAGVKKKIAAREVALSDWHVLIAADNEDFARDEPSLDPIMAPGQLCNRAYVQKTNTQVKLSFCVLNSQFYRMVYCALLHLLPPPPRFFCV
jgi:hypothetical protein